MSNTKRFAIILMVEIFLLIIGLVKVSLTISTFSAEIPNFTFEYMLGYSIPIVSMGMVVFLVSRHIMRQPKPISR
jgi:hypothetical protein